MCIRLRTDLRPVPGIPRGGFPAQTRPTNPPVPISRPRGDRPFSGLPATSPAPPAPVGEAQGKAGCRGCGWEAIMKLGPELGGHSARSAPGERGSKEKHFGERPFARALKPVGRSGRQLPPPATLYRGTNLPALCQTLASTCASTWTTCQATIMLPNLSLPIPPFVHRPRFTCTSQAQRSNPKHRVNSPSACTLLYTSVTACTLCSFAWTGSRTL